ncbi:MAG: sigma-54-dependent Fis family transcriptional regulator [Chlorobi bacterium]|nr:sigma-54-dependent Fis family transcriptional regulator [Chlorobiota bacterium]
MDLYTSISKEALETVHTCIEANSYLAAYPVGTNRLIHVLVFRPNEPWMHLDVQIEQPPSADETPSSLFDNREFSKIAFETIFKRTDIRHITQVISVSSALSREDVTISAIRWDSDPPFSSLEQKLLRAIAESFSNAVSLLTGGKSIHGHHSEIEYENLFEDYSINSSPPMLKVCELFNKAKSSTANILIQGEAGTGKQWMARAIHRRGPYGLEPFTVINCDLMRHGDIEHQFRALGKDSEHRDASSYVHRKINTLYLKEINALPIKLQALLYEVLLHQQRVDALSDSRDHLPVRIIASSNADVPALVSRGEFREDLYYLINIIPIHLPPLRKRKDDLPGLIGYFITMLSKRYDKEVTGIDGKCLTAMLRYRWPGNLLELETVIARAIVLAHNPILGVETLPDEIAHEAQKNQKGEILKSAGDLSLAQIERKIVLEALKECQGNQSAAARRLKISRDNLRYRIKKYEIRKEEYL